MPGAEPTDGEERTACSVGRQAIDDANAKPLEHTTITLGPPPTALPCRYQFQEPAFTEFWGPTALPAMQASITLQGAAPRNAVLDGNGQMRLIVVNSGAELTLQRVTITNGRGADTGGGIVNEGTLVLNRDTIVRGNIVEGDFGIGGGGIFSTSTVVLNDNSAIIDNLSLDGFGGGVYTGDTVILNDASIIARNSAARGGGGVLGDAILNDDSMITDNVPDDCLPSCS